MDDSVTQLVRRVLLLSGQEKQRHRQQRYQYPAKILQTCMRRCFQNYLPPPYALCSHRSGCPNPVHHDAIEAKNAFTRGGSCPRRPQPAGKPRLAPPHCTRTIRAAASGRDRLQECRSQCAANALGVGATGGGVGSDDRGNSPEIVDERLVRLAGMG